VYKKDLKYMRTYGKRAMEVYRPESPAMCAYEPESPRVISQYVPESPKKTVKLDPDSTLGKILNSMKNPTKAFTPTPFRPVHNWRNYVESLKLHMKREGWDKGEDYFTRCNSIIERIVKDHLEWEAKHPPKPPKEIIRGYDVPSTIDYVTVGLTVTKSGKVKARISAPLAIIYEKYFSKGVKPPTDVYIRALKEFGYPDEALEKVLLKAQNAPKLKAEMDAVFERVFGTTGPSKPSKPKRGTVTQEISKRLKSLGK
jgi:hypothetical protein